MDVADVIQESDGGCVLIAKKDFLHFFYVHVEEGAVNVNNA